MEMYKGVVGKGVRVGAVANLFYCKGLLDTLPFLDFQFQVVEIIWERSFIVEDIRTEFETDQRNQRSLHCCLAMSCLVMNSPSPLIVNLAPFILFSFSLWIALIRLWKKNHVDLILISPI